MISSCGATCWVKDVELGAKNGNRTFMAPKLWKPSVWGMLDKNA